MTPRTAAGGAVAGAVLAGLLVTGCDSTVTVAVENRSGQPMLLRVVGGGRSQAWIVDADAGGIGPSFPEASRPFVLVTTLDCDERGRLVLGAGRRTIVIEPSGIAPIDHEGIAAGVEALQPIDDPCPL